MARLSVDDTLSVAFTVNSSFAMPAAVALRGIADNVRGPVTVYIYDCGLSEDDKNMITASIIPREDLTVQFMDLPGDGVGRSLGASWARIDMMKTLPLNRVLYLDADILVRKDLRELWSTDLKGFALGVVPDPWMPTGHEYVRTPPGMFFNSGMLLVDLNQVRPTIPALEKLSARMKGTTLFHDQDPLNVHFRGHTLPLSDKWNAIGYGNCLPDEQRAKRFLQEAQDPAIVHFVGQANPSAMFVLTVPEYQTMSSKPWGYVGAQGHPFAEEWWAVLEKTAWKGYRKSVEFAERRDASKQRAMKVAEEEFERRINFC